MNAKDQDSGNHCEPMQECDYMGELSNTEILAELEKLMSGMDEDNFDSEVAERYLALLQKRAPVMEDYSPAAELARLQIADSELADRNESTSKKKGMHRRHIRILRIDDAEMAVIQQVLGTLQKRDENRYDTDPALKNIGEQYVSAESTPSPEKKLRQRPLKRSIAVAIAVLLLCGGLAAQALGADIFGSVARWSKGLFSFAPIEQGESDTSSEQTYGDLSSVLRSDGIDDRYIPKRIPNGFVFDEVQKFVNPGYIRYYAYFTNEQDELIITVVRNLNNDVEFYEVDDTEPVIYKVNDITHFLWQNMGKQTAIWSVDEYEYQISGDISNSDLIAMIDSIYE